MIFLNSITFFLSVFYISLRPQFQSISSIHLTARDLSVLRWIQRFAEEVSPLVNNLTPPHLSGVYLDEMVVHVRKESMDKGHYQWLLNRIYCVFLANIAFSSLTLSSSEKRTLRLSTYTLASSNLP